jgi:hypothetical protein
MHCSLLLLLVVVVGFVLLLLLLYWGVVQCPEHCRCADVQE